MKTRLPRKLKKKAKKIPIGSYCYADITIGDFEKAVRTKKNMRTYKRHGSFSCPYGRHQTHCSLLNVHEYLMLPDAVKICGIHEVKDALDVKKSKSFDHQVWYGDDGSKVRFTKDGMEKE